MKDSSDRDLGDATMRPWNDHGKGPVVRHPVLPKRRLIACVTTLLVATGLIAIGLTLSSFASASPGVTSVTLASPTYKPHASVGMIDDYHCTLLNPNLTKNSFLISSEFKPGSAEVHHAILAVVPPSLAAAARKENASNGGKGWTCFGAPTVQGASIHALFNTPFISTWGPGHGADILPKGFGIPLRAGSLLISQVHYNLLVGDKPVTNSVTLGTVPMSTPLIPLRWQELVAPPDIPCSPGVTGPLCDRAAELAHEAQQFGLTEVEIAGGIEEECGRDANHLQEGDTTSCLWPVRQSGYIVRAQAHMHLLGQSFSIVLNPGTPGAKTVLNVPNYNFHNQKAYNLKTPIRVKVGDTLQVTCTYDPALEQELPILRSVPPHFVTWGDGSTDEMCMGLTWTSQSLPKPGNSY